MLSVDMKTKCMTLFWLITLITTTLLNAAFGADIITSATDAAAATSTSTTIQQLEIKVYYEALCPDSIRFVRYPLYNAMIKKKLLKYTDLKFIPYGKVSKWIDPITNQEYLNCQHGQRECDKNALHACIVEHNAQFEQIQMIDCLLGRYKVNDCSTNLGINITAALECKSSRTIDDILKPYGEETDAIDIRFVPSVGVDGKFERNLQNEILHNFYNVFCSKYKEKYNILLTNCKE